MSTSVYSPCATSPKALPTDAETAKRRLAFQKSYSQEVGLGLIVYFHLAYLYTYMKHIVMNLQT